MAQDSNTPSFIHGYLFALGATAIWSGNFIVASGLSDAIPPVSLAFCRWTVAAAALFPFAIKHLISEWPVIKKHIRYFCITSFLGITSFNTLIYFAGRTTTALNLSLIAITFPIFVIILSRLIYRESLSIKKIAGILLVLTGVIMLITKGSLNALMSISFNIGDVWMLAASIIFAVYSLFLKNKPKDISIMGLQLSTFLIGLLFLIPFFCMGTVNWFFIILKQDNDSSYPLCRNLCLTYCLYSLEQGHCLTGPCQSRHGLLYPSFVQRWPGPSAFKGGGQHVAFL